jgi:hypothetical protein
VFGAKCATWMRTEARRERRIGHQKCQERDEAHPRNASARSAHNGLWAAPEHTARLIPPRRVRGGRLQ